MKEISYKDILKEARAAIDNARDWQRIESVSWWGNAHKYLHEAEVLIELVEVATCGSTGGYGEGQTEDDRQSLKARLKWLKKNVL